MKRHWVALLLFLNLFWVPGCQTRIRSIDSRIVKSEFIEHTDRQNTITPEVTETMLPEPTLTITVTITQEKQIEPAGCWRPPDDYTRVTVNGQSINARTYHMLSHAAELYAGVIDLTGLGITQGSYTDDEPLSFGTHAGGGAVDISVIARERFEILYDEIDPLIYALRVAGFAAWLRDVGELADYSPIHIHAIAIGDVELSQAARDQLTGQFGYFRGFNGIPTDYGVPILDPHGGPVICEWMLEMGYADLRDSSE